MVDSFDRSFSGAVSRFILVYLVRVLAGVVQSIGLLSHLSLNRPVQSYGVEMLHDYRCRRPQPYGPMTLDKTDQAYQNSHRALKGDAVLWYRTEISAHVLHHRYIVLFRSFFFSLLLFRES